MIRSWFTDTEPRDGDARPARPQVESRPVDQAWRQAARRRVVVVLTVLGVWAVVIQGRLVHVQVIQHEWLAERALYQEEVQYPLSGTRGDIVDRNGELLAYSVDGALVGADPSLIEDPAVAVDQMCEALADCTAGERRELAEKFARDTKWVPVRKARDVSPDQQARLEALNPGWITFHRESRRYYPARDLAAQVLGFVGSEDKGLFGLESRFDDVVGGEPGRINIRGVKKQTLLTEVLVPPTTGATLELTLDLRLQYEVEKALRAGVSANRAVGGTAIVLDTQTGEIFALANYPTFNPNDYQASAPSTWKNPAVQNVYEPGSTFKIITASAALEEGVYTPQSMFAVNQNGGTLRVSGRPTPIFDDHPSPVPLSLEDVVVKSSNVGAAMIGIELGPERLTRYARRFGLGATIADDFAGESAGILHSPERLRLADLATVAMGYTVAVTPLQMAAVAGAIANGGRLMRPYVVGAVVKDGVREVVEPKEIRQAVSARTAALMTSFLSNVVARGTATSARMARFDVAGKTGTAKKVEDGRYSDTDRVASFVGFVPASRPRFAILVVIDTPRAGAVYGGAVAAPVFKEIAEAAVRIEGLTPTIDQAPPYVVNADVEPLVEPASAVWPLPAASRASGQSLMPDVRGLSARDAVDVLHQMGVDVRTSGSGSVVSQRPAPGEPVVPGASGVLELRRVAVPAGGGGGR